MDEKKLPLETMEIVEKILKQGNVVELKRINGQIHVVEVRRKIKHKVTIING